MKRFLSILAMTVLAVSCSQTRKLENLRQNYVSASLSIPQEDPMMELRLDKPSRDTLIVQDFEGKEVLIMKAVRDDDGEMVAHDVIQAAYVTARFRNVAERHGKVDLCFQITVPKEMQDEKWQLRFQPHLKMLGEETRLNKVLITGNGYREAQLRGYQQYDRFIRSIVTDSTLFIDKHSLEIFIKRNIPQIYAFRDDSTYVSDEEFSSFFGVTQQEAIEHYTDKFARRRNNLKILSKDKMFKKYVRAPIETEGLRLDTVLTSINGDFVYEYVQTINTKPGLRSAAISLEGEIFEEEKRIYTVPETDDVTFYISSIAAFTDKTERYLTQVIERSVSENTSCYIDFEQGRHEVKEDYSNNRSEIARIRKNIADLLENEVYDLDSITVTASASPEGTYASNESLAKRRSSSIAAYMDRYIQHCQDSLDREKGFSVDEEGKVHRRERTSVPFLTKAVAENWEMLDRLVDSDATLSQDDKDDYASFRKEIDPDVRERLMQKKSYYKYVRENLYPNVRTVRFDFFLHRRGMVKDTVHTTVLDSVYMKGVAALENHDYETAVTLLRGYEDYNAAVAYCCMDYNASAKSILTRLPATAQVNYMLAVVYSREGDDRSAVEHYMHACAQEPSFVHRGNLDPEISSLIKKYGLNRDDEEYDY